MAEGGVMDVMENVVKTEAGEYTSLGDENNQPFAFLVRVTQWNVDLYP